MAARRRKVKTHKLGIEKLKKEIDKVIRRTEAAIAAGKKATKRAAKRRNAAAVASNLQTLQNTRWTLRNLNASFAAADDSCVEQILNSDPTFEE